MPPEQSATPFEHARAASSKKDPVASGELSLEPWRGFMVNRAVSMRADGWEIANLLNMHGNVNPANHYLVLRAVLQKRSSARDEYWPKGSTAKTASWVSDMFGVSGRKAEEILLACGEEALRREERSSKNEFTKKGKSNVVEIRED